MDIKKSILALQILGLSALFLSCENVLMDEDGATESSLENFEYLWQKVDEQYSYFRQKSIDWDAVYLEYKPKFSQPLSDEKTFEYLAEMLNELEDGHVNLVSDFNVSRHKFDQTWSRNFDYDLLEKHYIDSLSGELHSSLANGQSFKTKEREYISGPLLNQIFYIDNQSIGYVYYPSFMETIQESDWEYVLSRFANCSGIIFDVRDNGGGDPNNLFTILEKLILTEKYLYTSYLRNGPGHSDFDDGTKAILQPNPHKDSLDILPVRVLTNRSSFSATSFFAASVRSLNSQGVDIKLIGDYTGGGAGAPGGGELPNGWSYRLSVTQTTISQEALDINEMNKGIIPRNMFDLLFEFHFEAGVPPHIRVNMEETEIANGRDMILETAIEDLLR